MEKAKYEKPMLLELGFDRGAMGTNCAVGPDNLNNCKVGSNAKIKCDVGTNFAQSTVCISGSADVS